MNTDLKKVLLEFINDEENSNDFKDVFSKSVEGDYESFVTKLKSWAGDPKVTEFLKSGMKDGISSEDKFTVSSGSIACSALIPTQNEIDLNKSLDYPLKDPASAKTCLDGKDIMIGGAPIITFNGRYIIDGHHRWSQVYCINPNAKMKVLNFKKSGLGPEDMLKATQVAIAATTGTVAVQSVEGNNLLKMAPSDIMKYVFSHISDGSSKLLGRTKQSSAKRIALNAKQMQKTNQPIPGAPARGFMPQTDEPKGNLSNVVKALVSGQSQAIAPFEKQYNTEARILGSMAQKVQAPQEVINILKSFVENLKRERYTVSDNYYYWENFKNGPAVGASVGSNLVFVLDVTSKKMVKYSEELLVSVIKSGKIETPILMNRYINESKQIKESSAFGALKNNLAILALKDKNLSVTPDTLTSISDEDLQSWIEVVDADGKIRKRFTSKKAGTPNDSIGAAKALAPLVFDFYKLHIKKTGGAPTDDLADAPEKINELQSVDNKKYDLFDKVINKLTEAGVTEVDDLDVEDFIEYNYDLILSSIDTINPKLFAKNYINYVNQGETENINESLKKVLKEEDSVDAADPILMFQDFSDMSGSLADIYSTLVGYQTSYVQNPKVKAAMTQIMQGVNQLMKQTTATMQIIGSSFGLQESVNKKINESLTPNMETWTPEQWNEFEQLDVMKKMNFVSKLFPSLRTPNGIGQIIKATKVWAKSNYKGWEKVSNTSMGKKSILRQFFNTIPALKEQPVEVIKATVSIIADYWK